MASFLNKALPIIILSGIAFYACAVTAEKPKSVSSKYSESTCIDAAYGRTEEIQIQENGPTRNAFLFACAISPVVGEADQSKEEAQALLAKKLRLAGKLFTKGLDNTFTDESGNNLLGCVVLSSFPTKWKTEKVIFFLEAGVDPDQTNKYGKSAVELAEFQGNQRIVELLSGKK